MSKQPPPSPTASAIGPCPTIIQISRTPRHWKFTQHLRTTRPTPCKLVTTFDDEKLPGLVCPKSVGASLCNIFIDMYNKIRKIVYQLALHKALNYSRLSLSRSRKDPLKHFEISVLRHIRFAELREIPNEQLNFTHEHVI